MRYFSTSVFAIAMLALLLIGENCNKDKSINSPTGSVAFETSPLDYAAISQATPLGNLNPPGHTFPTNHIYLN